MADRFPELTDKHIQFIQKQHLFFVGTALAEGSVNVSPKGMDSFRVIDNKRIVWLNLTGSGNETAAHVHQNPRMTLMFCSFDKQPLILRLYGKATAVHVQDKTWAQWSELFPSDVGARQFFVMDIDLVLTSCGYGVPYYTYAGERPTLQKWSAKQGEQGVKDYWQEKNTVSLDGFDTGMVVPD